MNMKRTWRYYRRLAALYGSYRRRDAVVAAPPLRLWLEISSRCNLRCPACPNKDLPAAQKGDMPWPLFRRVVDQAREFALEVNLHHRGETLLHPDAGRMARYAAGAGLPCRLHTNATLLSGGVVGELLESGLQRLPSPSTASTPPPTRPAASAPASRRCGRTSSTSWSGDAAPGAACRG